MTLRRFVAPLALTAAGLVVALVLAEGVVRVYAKGQSWVARDLRSWDPFAIKVEPEGRYGYRQRPGAVFPYDNGTRATANQLGWRGPVVAIPKPPGTFRVVLLGGSTTHGWYVNDDQTIDAYLREDLRAQFPGRVIEVVNLAFDGYDAYQDWQRWQTDGLRLGPDAVVINEGINDVRNARFSGLGDPDPRTLIWESDMRRLREEAARGGPGLGSRIKHYLFIARLPGILREARSPTQQGSSHNEEVYPDAANNFELNIRRIVDSAVGRGIAVLLSTPPSALMVSGAPAFMAPRSYWVGSAAITQAYRDTLAARLQKLASEHVYAVSVLYVRHHLPPNDFLDDCHLTPAGNEFMASDFARALAPLLERPRGLGAGQVSGRVMAGPPLPRIIAEYPPTM